MIKGDRPKLGPKVGPKDGSVAHREGRKLDRHLRNLG